MNKRKITYRLFCIFFVAFFMFSPLQSIFAEAVQDAAATAQTEESAADESSETANTESKENTTTDEASANTADENEVITESEIEDSSNTLLNRIRRAVSSTSGVSISDLPVNIYDYNIVYEEVKDSEGNTSYWQGLTDQGINKGHQLYFKGAGGWNGTDPLNANMWIGTHWPDSGKLRSDQTGDNLAVHGIVEKTLVNGYPQLSAAAGSESLAYLYTPNDDTEVMTSYGQGITGLFNRDGNHYWFNSDNEDAHWDRTTNTFTKTDGNTNRVKFLPFNTRSESADMGFGMTFDLNFEMPYDTSENATFRFSGDDDVWVYVDGVLALDIGGIHGAAGGTIDFKRGIVKYDDHPVKIGATSTDVEQNSQYYTFEQLGLNLDNFTAGSDHQLKFFYNERGDGLSNCSIDFELPLLVETTISKEVYGEEDNRKLEDEYDYYYFYLMYKAPNATEYTPLTKDKVKKNFEPFWTGKYGMVGEVNWSDSIPNTFCLRDGESSTFYLPQGSSYYIVESQPLEAGIPGAALGGEVPLYTTFQNDDEELETVWNNDTSVDITQTQITEIDASKVKRHTLVTNYTPDGRGIFTVTKTVVGLTKSILGDQSYEFELTLDETYPSNVLTKINEEDGVTTYSPLTAEVKEDGSRVIRFSLKDGESLRVYNHSNLDYNHKIREINPETNEGFVHFKPVYAAYYGSYESWDDGLYTPEELNNLSLASDVHVTNVQTPYDLTVTKEVEGNLGDKSQQFDFTIRLTDQNGQVLADEYVTSLIQNEEGGYTREAEKVDENGNVIIVEEENIQTTSTDENGEIKFSLANGEGIKFRLTEGVKYTIVEDTQLSGYETKSIVTRDSDNTEITKGKNTLETVTMTTDNVTAAFTNTANIAPATSMNVNAYWPVAIGAVLIIGLVAFTVRRQVKGN